MNEGTTQRGDLGRPSSSGFFSYQNPVADASLHTALLGPRNTSSAGGSMISNNSPSPSVGGANPSHAISVDAAPPRSPHPMAQRDVLIAGASYILSSAGLILFNKHALSSFNFQCPNCLLFFHCLLSAALVKFVELMGWSRQPIEPLKLRIVQLWLPVNLIFVGMIATSFLALRLVGVGMFTVLKNLSNLLAIGGDYVFFGRTYPAVIWLCIALMIGSAMVGGITDVHFNMEGYAWQLVNCLFTSAYALYLSHVMVRVQQYTHDQKRMGELSMVYYNNLLSLGPIALLAIGFGEVQRLPSQAALRDPEFLIVALVGGLLGFLISFASLWFMSRSSATVYSLTGSMNKIFVALAGIILFQEHATWGNLASIAVGLAAGTVFVMAKAYVVK